MIIIFWIYLSFLYCFLSILAWMVLFGIVLFFFLHVEMYTCFVNKVYDRGSVVFSFLVFLILAVKHKTISLIDFLYYGIEV
jgi:hypothetical protein